MTGKRLFAIGLGAYFFALIATLPATFVDNGLKRVSNGRLRLVDASGTLWSGTGQIELRDADGRYGVSEDIAWRCLPRSLIGGHLVFDVEMEQSPKSFPVTISMSQISVANADIRLPAAVLGLGVPRLTPLGLGGDVSLHISDISLQSDEVRGAATLQWRSASSALTPIAPFGDYELRFDRESPMPSTSLRTLQGPLLIEGKETADSAGEPVFLATLRVPSSLQQQLAPLLRLLAVERSEGIFDLPVK